MERSGSGSVTTAILPVSRGVVGTPWGHCDSVLDVQNGLYVRCTICTHAHLAAREPNGAGRAKRT